MSIECGHLVIGAGAVGLACARKLSRRAPTIVIERNATFGQEISSRNSQVLHSGIYYPKQSLKTILCIRGQQLMYEYLKFNSVPFNKCGKWVCAQSNEVPKLLKIQQHCQDLGLKVELQSKEKCLEIEPNVKVDLALVVEETGIIDSHLYMQSMEQDVLNNDGIFSYHCELVKVERLLDGKFKSTIKTLGTTFEITSDTVINSAGLGSDKIAKFSGKYVKYFYAKGHYFKTNQRLASRLIYPIPDANLASLGLHLTLNLDGSIKFGPDLQHQDEIDYAPNAMDLTIVKNEISKYLLKVPTDLSFDYTGIRPKLANLGEGFRDFEIENRDGFVNLLGIESPGLTSSMAIGDHVEGLLYR